MSKRLIIVNRCPLCGERVKVVPDAVLKKNPHQDGTEMVVTRTGLKQYLHTSCWDEMIKEKRPYDGRLFL